jgi:transposase
MSAYSEDLRRRIVSSVEGEMPKAEAARTFSVSLSSLKRSLQKARRGGSLAPKKRSGAAPKLDKKAMKLLEEDLEERPFATLRERRDYVGVTTGLWMSRSTECRAITRLGRTRKKGASSHPTRRVSKGGLAGDGGRGTQWSPRGSSSWTSALRTPRSLRSTATLARASGCAFRCRGGGARTRRSWRA